MSTDLVIGGDFLRISASGSILSVRQIAACLSPHVEKSNSAKYERLEK